MIIWRITDGRRGHENQTEGLASALARRVTTETVAVPAPPTRAALGHLAGRRFPPGEGLPDPDLVLGAGHDTHLPLLAARRARGGRAVVLMRPTLPARCFDLCIVPEHDGVPGGPRVLVTRGALNRVVPGDPAARRGGGLILLGGPSRDHGWEGAAVAAQVEALVGADPQTAWTATTSRRTPADTVARVERAAPGLRMVLFHTVTGDWLPGALADSREVWVTEDSASMLYEALTSGAAVGVLEVPRLRAGRVAGGAERLCEHGLVTPFARWREGQAPAPPAQPFCEADRCAEELLRRWPELAG